MPYEVKFIGTVLTPIMMLAGFVAYYVLAELRNFVANRIGKKLLPFAFWSFYEKTKVRSSNKLAGLFSDIKRIVLNEVIYMRNYLLWFFNTAATREQMHIFRDGTICSYMVFIFFAYDDQQFY